MASITVTMPYIQNLTANHAYMQKGSCRFMRPEVRKWQRACALTLGQALIGNRPVAPLAVRIDWQGPMQPDEDGKAKVIWDAIQMATGINDRHYIAIPGGFERRNAWEANITITIEWEG
jgi:hypothetical protein